MRRSIAAAIAAAGFFAAARPIAAQVPLRGAVYASGLTSPIAFVQDPTDAAVQLAVEQGGRVRVIRNGVVLSPDFLDLRGFITSGGERGLLGLAFAPDYASSGRFFVNFTNQSGHTVVARFRRSANPLVADAGSRFDLRWGGVNGNAFITQPYANHNGGHLAFGPDGYLYVGLGDGGSGGDPQNYAQTPSSFLGKMLRVDVGVLDADPIGYRIPADNPFVSTGPPGTRPEIWSLGYRNPWRYTFDDPTRGGTGALIVGDVGQGNWEEVDYEPANRGGRNYGWRNREGAHGFDNSVAPPLLPLVDPIHEYSHGTGQSITGGYVYRGRALGPTHQGRYFFADFVTGRVWSLGLVLDQSGEATAGALVEHTASLGGTATIGNVSAFGTDADGELYVVNYSAGTIVKIVSSASRTTDFDNDARADIAVYRPESGTWLALSSTAGRPNTVRLWGVPGDIPVADDYDGDGRIDFATFRPATTGPGMWNILRSGTAFTTALFFNLGAAGDLPVPADYDGDEKADPAVYRPLSGTWYFLKSTTSYVTGPGVQWGLNGDIPVPGDYDGDRKTDLVVYRPSTGIWYILKSSTNLSTNQLVQWGLAGDVPMPGDFDGDAIADIAVYRPSTGQWFLLFSRNGFTTFASYQWGLDGDRPVPGDFDGDGKTDLAVFRPSTGVWYVLYSGAGYTTFTTVTWGLITDVPVPNSALSVAIAAANHTGLDPTLASLTRGNDFDGDGRADVTMYRPSSGTWFSRQSSVKYNAASTIALGPASPPALPPILPVAGDYDGDRRTDAGTYAVTTGIWSFQLTTLGAATYQFGLTGDLPVQGDYDGDRLFDLAVYRPSSGEWILRRSTNVNALLTFQWGLPGDVPAPGDYDGDGKTDLAVFRPASGVWYIRTSSSSYSTFVAYQWGLGGDITAPSDYDGDGKTDLAVFRPASGVWFITFAASNFVTSSAYQWGLPSDVPVAADYDGDGKTDLAVWRPSTGTWYLLSSLTGFSTSTTVSWGLSSDIPIH